MSTQMKINRFIRSVLQGRTPQTVSTTAMPAAVSQAYAAMAAAAWTRVTAKTATLPRHNWGQTGFLPTFDAATYCGDYANGYQHAYACAVCYTYRMPATALDGTPAKIQTVSIPALGDRWLADGCDIGVWLSASATPPAWAVVLAGTGRADNKTAQMAVTPSNSGADSSVDVVFDWSAAPKTALAYVHVVVSMTSYLTHRIAWIEGGAMIDGPNVDWVFDEDGVTADSTDVFDTPVTPPTPVWAMVPSHIEPQTGSPSGKRGRYSSHAEYGFSSEGLAELEWRHAVINFFAFGATSFGEVPYGGKGAYLWRPAGWDYAVCIASDFDYQFYASGGQTFDAVIFKYFTSFAPPVGVNVRMVLYSVAEAVQTSDWMAILEAPTVPAAVYLGTATTLSMAVNGIFVAKAATCVMNVVLTGGTTYAGGYAFPLLANYTPIGPTMLLLVMSVADVTSSPGTTGDTAYGITFTPEVGLYLRVKA